MNMSRDAIFRSTNFLMMFRLKKGEQKRLLFN